MSAKTLSAATLLANYPAETNHAANEVTAAWTPTRHLIVLDDDPTGTQSVANLPVLAQWEPSDFTWALDHGAPAIYVLTNTRSLDPQAAADRNAEIVRNALAAAQGTKAQLTFVSRGDSTLRGHYPLETDVIAATVASETGEITDAVILVPAFPDAGRVTIGGVHYMRSGDDLTPIAETEFAQDATFGYKSSDLREYVAEKTEGRHAAADVIVLDLNLIRAANPATAIADALENATNRNGHATPVVADCVNESDLRALALGLQEAENRGKKLLYRVGPPFGRGRIGQEIHPPLSSEDAYAGLKPSLAGGLIVVGSHVGVTTRQLNDLTAQHAHAQTIEIDVTQLLDTTEVAEAHLSAIVERIVAALHEGDVITHTSRLLIKTDDPAESLRIARTVSAAVVAVVNRVLKTFPPRFVIAKGGITSSDVAAHGLEIRHAIVRGPMLPGIVSLWEPMSGPAQGIPYIVFAGNVGDDESLTAVTRKLSNTF